jgi:hypothetical protein
MLHLILKVNFCDNLPNESVPVVLFSKEKDTRGTTTVRNVEEIMNFDNMIISGEFLYKKTTSLLLVQKN